MNLNRFQIEKQDIAEESNLNYTILCPGYLRDGNADDYVLTINRRESTYNRDFYKTNKSRPTNRICPM